MPHDCLAMRCRLDNQRCDRTTRRRLGRKTIRSSGNRLIYERRSGRGTSQDAGVSLRGEPAPTSSRPRGPDSLESSDSAATTDQDFGRGRARPARHREAHGRRRYLGPALHARRPGPGLVRRSVSPAARPPLSGWPGRHRRGREPAPGLADRDRQDARRVPGDPRRALPRARRRARSRPGCGASTSRRCGASATTSSGTSRTRSRRSGAASGWRRARSRSASGPATPRRTIAGSSATSRRTS